MSVTRSGLRVPNLGSMFRRWQAEADALTHEPYTVRVRSTKDVTIARLGDRAYFTATTDPAPFRVVTPSDADALDTLYEQERKIRQLITARARAAYRRGRPVTASELAAAEARVYGPDMEPGAVAS